MPKRLTVALVGSAAMAGCGGVAVSGNDGDAAAVPAQALVQPEAGAPNAWRSAPKLPALAPHRRERVHHRHRHAAAAKHADAAPRASTPSAPAVAPAAPAPAPAAPAPAVPQATAPPPAPAPKPAPAPAPPVDFLSSG